jgi:hypothetical protein
MFTATNEKTYTLDGRQPVLWDELGFGAPTLIAFARLCSEALAAPRPLAEESLGVEARIILYAARRRGALEIKGVNNAFDSSERLLAVCVEVDADRQVVFRRRDDPELTIRFLDGFRQLCVSGLVMHHLFREFSLTRAGFELARTIPRQDVAILEEFAGEQLLGDF